MTDPKGTWSDGGKVWNGEPTQGATICPHCHATVLSSGQPERAEIDDVPRAEFEIVRTASRMLEDASNAWMERALKAEAALAATPAVGGGLEALADHIEYEQARGVDIPLSDGEAAQIVAMLRTAPPASPLRQGAPKPLTLTDITIHNTEVAKAVAAQEPASPLRGREDKSLDICLETYGLDYMQRRHVLEKVNAKIAAALASPPEQPAERPGYREYAALSIVEQAVKDMAGIGGDISGVTCQKMKKLIQTIEPCKRCGGSGWLETVECPNCEQKAKNQGRDHAS